MRDWDGNGKIEGRDYYLFHEEILKDSSNTDDYTTHASSFSRRNVPFDSDKKPQKEIGCLSIFLVNVVLIILLAIIRSL